MTHRGPFQPLPFCDSVTYQEHPYQLSIQANTPGAGCRGRSHPLALSVCLWVPVSVALPQDMALVLGHPGTTVDMQSWYQLAGSMVAGEPTSPWGHRAGSAHVTACFACLSAESICSIRCAAPIWKALKQLLMHF